VSETDRPIAAARLGTEEVARRLGVKRETVYAYVSRGLLERHPASGPHHSEFDPEEVERLAARARRPDASSALEVVVETELTLLEPEGRLSYRGRDAVELAKFRSFEEVVSLLWDGAPPTPWELDDERALRPLDQRRDRGVLPLAEHRVGAAGELAEHGQRLLTDAGAQPGVGGRGSGGSGRHGTDSRQHHRQAGAARAACGRGRRL